MHVSAEGTLLHRSYPASQLLFPSPTPTETNSALLIPPSRRRLGMLRRRGCLVGLPDALTVCRRPLSPVTPRSPIAAFVHCFAIGVGFSFFGSLATPSCVTRPNRVHLRYGWRLRLPRLQLADCSSKLLGRLHGERTLTMVSTFQLTRTARLNWRTEDHEGKVLIFSLNPFVSFLFQLCLLIGRR